MVNLATVGSANAKWLSKTGNFGVRYEQKIYVFASHFSRADDEAGIRAYSGGCWLLESLPVHDNDYFWYRLRAEQRFRFINDDAYVDEVVDAEVFSMALNLFASSHLAFELFERVSRLESEGKLEAQIAPYRELNEYFCELHHASRDYFMDLLVDKPSMRTVLFKMID